MTERSRALRRGSTDAERVLWQRLRDRQIAGAKFRRQHQRGPYILDFYCAEYRLAIEVDGGHHADSRQVTRDLRRTRYLEDSGVQVIRFTDSQVLTETEAVLETIRLTLESDGGWCSG